MGKLHVLWKRYLTAQTDVNVFYSKLNKMQASISFAGTTAKSSYELLTTGIVNGADIDRL